MSRRSIASFAAWRHCASFLCCMILSGMGPSTTLAEESTGTADVIQGEQENPAEAKKPKADQKLTAHDYFPMSLGDRWVYRKTVAYEGEEPAVTETFSLVRGEYLFNGELWRHFEEDGICFWVYVRDEGQFEADVSYDEETLGLQIDREFPVFRFPVQQGDEWLYLADMSADAKPGTVKCLDVDQEVTTPAGKFRCLVYEIDDEESKSTYRFAPRVGLVSCEWKHKSEGKESIILDLKRFLPGRIRGKAPAGPETEPADARPETQ